jgi:hypothetical protein
LGGLIAFRCPGGIEWANGAGIDAEPEYRSAGRVNAKGIVGAANPRQRARLRIGATLYT